ncbi:hypothetical protein LG299_08750 [Microbacterium lacus]|uniref:hypothetical protein n=1 Tax=Microbacterium lacus TaxID=415217 RepID=UPI00384DBFB5
MSEPTPTSTSTSKPTQTVTVTKSTAIWVIVGAVIVAIVAALLGGWIGGAVATRDEAAPSASPSPTPSPEPSEDPEIDEEALEEIVSEIMPAGSAVRVGRGEPAADQGRVGDVYINLTNSDVFVLRESGWERVGNLRVDMAENLVGPEGAPGAPGGTGETGASGAPGQDGTQVVLGDGAPPADATCEPDGSVYIDTSTSTYYSCVAGVWALFGEEPATE